MSNMPPTSPSSELDAQALATAYAACSLTEQLQLVERDVREFVALVPLELRGEGQLVLDRITALVKATNDGDVKVSEIVGRQLTSIKRSKVEQLKLGGEIIRKRRGDSLSYDQIAQDLGISVESVRSFCRSYDSASPAERARMERASIFDTVRQLEDISTLIYRQLARLEGCDPEHHVKYVSELRQVIKLANDFASKMSQQRQIEELKSAVISILSEIEPSKVEAFIARVRVVGFPGMETAGGAAITTKSTVIA